MARDPYSLWPREHGAYAQLGVALLCGAVLGHGFRGLCQAGLTLGLFLATEPLLVILGRRGPAVKEGAQVRAGFRLFLLGSLAVLAAMGAWLGAPASQWLALFPPALLGGALFLLFLAGKERTAAGEFLAAWTFSAAAGTVALLGGSGLRRATLLVALLAGMLSLATAMVHGQLLALKRGGPRGAPLLLALALTLGALALGWRGLVPRGAFGVFLPMTLATLRLRFAPPSPGGMKAVGWTAAACALAGGGIAMFILR